MPRVKIINDVYVEATGTHYKAGTEDEVSEVLFKRHGDKGTGFMKLVKQESAAKQSKK